LALRFLLARMYITFLCNVGSYFQSILSIIRSLQKAGSARLT
jgi:hypothetical protein